MKSHLLQDKAEVLYPTCSCYSHICSEHGEQQQLTITSRHVALHTFFLHSIDLEHASVVSCFLWRVQLRAGSCVHAGERRGSSMD